MATIALIGPGAIGGAVAAALASSGDNDVTLCARTPFDELNVALPDGTVFEKRLRVLTNPRAATTPVDWIVAVTKTYDTAGAARWMTEGALLGPSTVVVVIQNGVEHLERFKDVVPALRTLPAIIDIPAERLAPGRIRQRRNGDVTVPNGELGRRFAAFFSTPAVIAQTSDDFITVAWRKLVVNSAGAVNALTLKPARIAHEPKIATLIHAIAQETVLVGRACGAQLSDSYADEVLARARASAPDAANSMLADRLANRPLEVDARNGVVVRLGAIHHIPTPLNQAVVAILETAVS